MPTLNHVGELWYVLVNFGPLPLYLLGAPFVAAGIMWYVCKRPHLWQCTMGGKR